MKPVPYSAHRLFRWLLVISSLAMSACATREPLSSLPQAQEQFAQTYHQSWPGLVLHNANPQELPTSNVFIKPLDLPTSLQLMLQYSPQVRKAIARLGIADASVLQAQLIDNPHLALGALRPEDGGRWQLETGISQPLLSFFTRPLQRQLAQQQLASAQLELQVSIHKLISTTTHNYYEALATQQEKAMYAQLLATAQAQHDLAQGLYAAGNIPENRFLYYQKELNLVHLQQLDAVQKAESARLTLLQQLGIASTSAITLPNDLPLPPQDRFNRHQLLADAMASRQDLQLIRLQQDQLQQRRQLLRKESGWRDMKLGVNAEREFDGAVNIGPEIEFALPLFNRAQGKQAVLDAELAIAQANYDQTLLNIEREITQALMTLDATQQSLALLQTTLPIAEKRLVLSLREVNFMLASPFELLNDKREVINLHKQNIQILKTYWQARADLELAIAKPLAIALQSMPGTQHQHSHQEHHHD